jgi:hypothetical protein
VRCISSEISQNRLERPRKDQINFKVQDRKCRIHSFVLWNHNLSSGDSTLLDVVQLELECVVDPFCYGVSHPTMLNSHRELYVDISQYFV